MHDFIGDVFRGVGIAYYSFTSQIGYFERALIVVLLYTTVWFYSSVGTAQIQHYLNNFQEGIKHFIKEFNNN